jgi:hypothetical protein
VLIAAETEIPAHKVVLSSCTSYFYAMFTQDLAEAKADRITLQEIDPKALVLLIDFIYTSEIFVIMSVKAFRTDIIVFICDFIMCFTSD